MSETTLEEKVNYIIEQQAETITQLKSDVHTIINKSYPDLDTRLVQVGLEKSYEDIIELNPELDGVSAVGLKVILNYGDTIYRNGNRMFYLNGTIYEEITADSLQSIAEEGKTEVAIVWIFANNGEISFDDNFDLLLIESVIINKIPNLTNVPYKYYNAPKVTAENFTINLHPTDHNSYIQDINYKSTGTALLKYKIGSTRKITSDLRAITRQIASIEISESTNFLEELSFPDLKTISSMNTTTLFWKNNLPRTKIKMPRIESIEGFDYDPQILFRGYVDVEIPESCMSIQRSIFERGDNANKNPSVSLKNKDATFSDNWYYNDNTSGAFEMCNDWGATINISKAAYSWGIEKFQDLIQNKLRDMTLTNETRQLTIPTTAYNSLSDEDFSIAEDKGWTLQGA